MCVPASGCPERWVCEALCRGEAEEGGPSSCLEKGGVGRTLTGHSRPALRGTPQRGRFRGALPAAPVSARGGFCVRRPPPRCSGDDAAVLPGGGPRPGRWGREGPASSQARLGLLRLASGVPEHVVSVTSAGQMHSKGLWGRVSLLKTLLWSSLPLGWGLSACLTRVVAPLRPLRLQARWHRFLPRAPVPMVPLVPLKLVASWAHRLRSWVSRRTAGPGTGKVTRFLACSTPILAL